MPPIVYKMGSLSSQPPQKQRSKFILAIATVLGLVLCSIIVLIVAMPSHHAPRRDPKPRRTVQMAPSSALVSTARIAPPQQITTPLMPQLQTPLPTAQQSEWQQVAQQAQALSYEYLHLGHMLQERLVQPTQQSPTSEIRSNPQTEQIDENMKQIYWNEMQNCQQFAHIWFELANVAHDLATSGVQNTSQDELRLKRVAQNLQPSDSYKAQDFCSLSQDYVEMANIFIELAVEAMAKGEKELAQIDLQLADNCKQKAQICLNHCRAYNALSQNWTQIVLTNNYDPSVWSSFVQEEYQAVQDWINLNF
ncbi:MAG TPA: hypothetical protein VKV29_01160 [Chthonomonas sp.]|jgi:hypothetical protein|uniref:hypothetical protein n=1 Tax=Chthonomonas sp. TaxID=2282153 RepID=UPI002B4B199D|nr:hypothetical protein [Chthonomonas sp.]HLH78870.1 hypothetical protein [Chthonomonas sp.]